MVDMGESDARRLVPQSEEHWEGVFRRFQERMERLTKERWDHILESSDRRGASYEVFKLR